MRTKSKAEKASKSQSQLFVDKALEIGADGASEDYLVMRRLAQQSKTGRKPLKKKKAAK